MRVVLDTNVLVLGIFWTGTPSKIVELWTRENFELVASESILDEYLTTILRVTKQSNRPDLYERWSLFLPKKLTLVMCKKHFKIWRDPKDDQFLDGAVAGKAKYLVSGDKDLLVLEKVMGVSKKTG